MFDNFLKILRIWKLLLYYKIHFKASNSIFCILKHLEQSLTESQRSIATDPNLGNSALLSFLLEHENEPPEGLILPADFEIPSEEVPGIAQQQQEKPLADKSGQLPLLKDLIDKEAIFWFYHPPITLASYEIELRSNRANIVKDATIADSLTNERSQHMKLSSKEIDFLLFFIQQACNL